jgi:vacuolar-type H+-ATPase subunit C/Vma6
MGHDEGPRLVETTIVSEVWADGIGKIEKIGKGTYRIYFYRVKRPLNGEGPEEHEIVATIITSFAHIQSTLTMLNELAIEVTFPRLH